MWLDTNTVRPSAASPRSNVRTSRMPGGSSPFAGSSRIRSSGSFISAAATPEPLLHPERVGREATLGARQRARPVRARRRRASRRCRGRGRAARGCAGRVKFGKNDGCSTRAPTRSIDVGQVAGHVARRARGSRPRAPRSSPTIARIAVVLPAPFAPRKPNTPPSGTLRSRPSSRDHEPRRRPVRHPQVLELDCRPFAPARVGPTGVQDTDVRGSLAGCIVTRWHVSTPGRARPLPESLAAWAPGRARVPPTGVS